MFLDELIANTLRGRNVAEYCRDAGRPVTDSRMRDLLKPNLKWEEYLAPETMLGIARASGVSLDEVVRACSRSIARWKGRPELAMHQEESTLLALMPPGTARLREDQVEAIIAHVTADLLSVQMATVPTLRPADHPVGTNGPSATGATEKQPRRASLAPANAG